MPDTTYDPEADAFYIHLSASSPVEAEEVAPNVSLDLDADGRVVGIEILTASRVLGAGDWSRARRPGASPLAAE